jgi:sugar phosphate isomerase/epimerase
VGSARDRFGFYGPILPGADIDPPTGWWRYRLPGLGSVDFRRYVDVLREGGYDGVLSIEHEDEAWSGSVERVQEGLVLAQRALLPLVFD